MKYKEAAKDFARCCLMWRNTIRYCRTMNSSNGAVGAPGPFEVKFEECETASSAVHNSRSQFPSPTLYSRAVEVDTPPRRRYECAHYDTCLELAAALNWSSFTCRGCSGEVNESLRWRAGQMARKDSIAKRLCGFPKLVALKGAAPKKPLVENS